MFVLGATCALTAMFFLMTPQHLAPTVVESAAPVQTAPVQPAMASSPAAVAISSAMTVQASAEGPGAIRLPLASDASHAGPDIPVKATAPDAAAAPAPMPTQAASQELMIPVEGIAASQLHDTFEDARAVGRRHDAIDIMAPKGTRILAVADGKVAKLFTSVRGGLTVYEFDSSETYTYYYAHMDSYAPGLSEGRQLKRGDLIGFVGSTGDASATAPHLHFEISLLGPEKHWWQGTAINPYPILSGRETLASAASASTR